MAEKTAYHVLRELPNNGDAALKYEPLAANVEAHSAADALRQTVTETGRYVAIPARSFMPTDVKLETTTIVKVGA